MLCWSHWKSRASIRFDVLAVRVGANQCGNRKRLCCDSIDQGLREAAGFSHQFTGPVWGRTPSEDPKLSRVNYSPAACHSIRCSNMCAQCRAVSKALMLPSCWIAAFSNRTISFSSNTSARLPTLPLASNAAISDLSVIGVFRGTTSHSLSGANPLRLPLALSGSRPLPNAANAPSDRASRSVSIRYPRNRACKPHGIQSRRPPRNARMRAAQ